MIPIWSLTQSPNLINNSFNKSVSKVIKTLVLPARPHTPKYIQSIVEEIMFDGYAR